MVSLGTTRLRVLQDHCTSCIMSRLRVSLGTTRLRVLQVLWSFRLPVHLCVSLGTTRLRVLQDVTLCALGERIPEFH